MLSLFIPLSKYNSPVFSVIGITNEHVLLLSTWTGSSPPSKTLKKLHLNSFGRIPNSFQINLISLNSFMS